MVAVTPLLGSPVNGCCPPTPIPTHLQKSTLFSCSNFFSSRSSTDASCRLKSPDLLRRQETWASMRCLLEGRAPRTQGPTGQVPLSESEAGVANANAPSSASPSPASPSSPAPAPPFLPQQPPSPTALSQYRHRGRQGAGAGKDGWGAASVIRFCRTTGSLSGHPSALGPARPPPVAASSSPGSPSAAHLSNEPAPTRRVASS